MSMLKVYSGVSQFNEHNPPQSRTARELLEKLQALDERTLDMPIYVQRSDGGYDSVKTVLITNPGPSHAKTIAVIKC